MSTSKTLPAADIDLATLGHALWRAKRWILGLTLLAGAITFIGLSMMRPLYTSEARILVQNEDSAFTRPTGEDGRNGYRTPLDEQAVQSQVQVLTSRDLILQVVKDLDLTKLHALTTHVKLDDVPQVAADIVAGKVKGRVVVDIRS